MSLLVENRKYSDDRGFRNVHVHKISDVVLIEESLNRLNLDDDYTDTGASDLKFETDKEHAENQERINDNVIAIYIEKPDIQQSNKATQNVKRKASCRRESSTRGEFSQESFDGSEVKGDDLLARGKDNKKSNKNSNKPYDKVDDGKVEFQNQEIRPQQQQQRLQQLQQRDYQQQQQQQWQQPMHQYEQQHHQQQSTQHKNNNNYYYSSCVYQTPVTVNDYNKTANNFTGGYVIINPTDQQLLTDFCPDNNNYIDANNNYINENLNNINSLTNSSSIKIENINGSNYYQQLNAASSYVQQLMQPQQRQPQQQQPRQQNYCQPPQNLHCQQQQQQQHYYQHQDQQPQQHEIQRRPSQFDVMNSSDQVFYSNSTIAPSNNNGTCINNNIINNNNSSNTFHQSKHVCDIYDPNTATTHKHVTAHNSNIYFDSLGANINCDINNNYINSNYNINNNNGYYINDNIKNSVDNNNNGRNVLTHNIDHSKNASINKPNTTNNNNSNNNNTLTKLPLISPPSQFQRPVTAAASKTSCQSLPFERSPSSGYAGSCNDAESQSPKSEFEEFLVKSELMQELEKALHNECSDDEVPSEVLTWSNEKDDNDINNINVSNNMAANDDVIDLICNGVDVDGVVADVVGTEFENFPYFPVLTHEDTTKFFDDLEKKDNAQHVRYLAYLKNDCKYLSPIPAEENLIWHRKLASMTLNDIMRCDGDGDTTLMQAALKCEYEFVKPLIDRYLREGKLSDLINRKNVYDKSALFYAVVSKKPAVTSLLISVGADTNITVKLSSSNVSGFKYTSLLGFCIGMINKDGLGIGTLIELLRAPDLNVNVSDSDGCTPLHIAINKFVEKPATFAAIIEHLIMRGADISAQNTKDERTPLHYALLTGHYHLLLHFLASVKKCYRHESKSKIRNMLNPCYGFNALKTVYELNFLDVESKNMMIKLLLLHGCELNQRSPNVALRKELMNNPEIAEIIKKMTAKKKSSNNNNIINNNISSSNINNNNNS
ncbi:hypothetical protein HELRODRAFT_190880 [Helobdella robusta]|uniref:Uncharacterized protein n=1 Tax=Helobdella robusta TaxID=6412 RepID=T1FSD8_HELRO|nr:hypothetical protein HELRODRAFT_190880 [Helobdella robusta]ESO08086.1 hypothetical protein HELRODRAFT_190880 [Helobdella robusta]